MALPRWQATIVDDAGDILPSAEVTVIVESTGLAASLFSDRAGSTAKGTSGVFSADTNGFAFFYADPAPYRITAEASGGGTSVTWNYVSLFDFDANVGTAAGEVPLNSTLVPKSGGIFTGEVTYYGGGAVSTNTSYGTGALEDNTTGLQSSAFGYRVLYNQTTGGNNTGLGFRALRENTIGDNNTASGYEALRNNIGGDFNTGYGYQSLTIGTAWNNTTGLGRSAQVTGSDQVQLGNSSTTTYVYGTVQNRSDLRDKTDVRDTVLGLYFIQSLRPVDYRWDLREDYRPDAPIEPDPLKDDATDKEIEAHELALAQYENDRSEWLISVKHENLIHDGTHKRTRYHHGLIAQEVYEVIADSGVDFGGYQDHKVAGGEDVLSIGYDELIGPLIKALQELKKEFDDYVNDHP